MNISLRSISIFGKFPFIKLQQLIDNPRYLLHLLVKNFWYKFDKTNFKDKYSNIEIMTPNETLDYLISNEVSLARFSDGEFDILTGAGIYPPDSNWSQKWSFKLQQQLGETLSSSDQRLLIAVDPKETFLSTKKQEHSIPFEYNMWIDMRRMMWKYLLEGKKYGHCHLFIRANAPDFNWSKFRSYVQRFDVVVVTGNIKNIKHLSMGRSTHFIDFGTENAYSKIEQIKSAIVSYIENEKLNKRNTIVFASLGPTACILAHDLLDHQIRVWDTGHMFEFADKNFMESVFNNEHT